MKFLNFLILIFYTNGFFVPTSLGLTKATYSVMLQSFTANAGGQQTYALRKSTEHSEWSLFSNQYLRSGKLPLSGAVYSLRFPVGSDHEAMKNYTQIGIGLSNAGPMVEILWGSIFFWVCRVDVATQFFFTLERPVLWSYPLWLGLSFPFF